MRRFKNVSSLGDLEIPVLRADLIEAGSIFEVPDEFVEYFACQPANFQPVPDDIAGLTGKDLDQALEDAGLEPGGKAAEKRARLLEYFPEPEPEPDDVDETPAGNEPTRPDDAEIVSPHLHLRRPDVEPGVDDDAEVDADENGDTPPAEDPPASTGTPPADPAVGDGTDDDDETEENDR